MLSQLKKLAVPSSSVSRRFPLSQDTCFDIVNMEDFPIDKYIKGEFISEDYPEVPKEEARKRLVFFVGTPDNLKPYCSNIDDLEREIDVSVYSGNCYNSNVPFEQGKFTNVIYKLNFEYPVYVMLSDLLSAVLYSGKQIFAVVPTDRKYNKTQSLDVFLGGTYVGADHCQDGSDKRIYEIVSCSDEDEWCIKHSDAEEPLTDEERSRLEQEIDRDLSRRRNERLGQPDEIDGDSDYEDDDDEDDPYSDYFQLFHDWSNDSENSVPFEIFWRQKLDPSANTMDQINNNIRYLKKLVKFLEYCIGEYEFDRDALDIIFTLIWYYFRGDRDLPPIEFINELKNRVKRKDLHIVDVLYPELANVIERLAPIRSLQTLKRIALIYDIRVSQRGKKNSLLLKLLIIFELDYKMRRGEDTDFEEILESL